MTTVKSPFVQQTLATIMLVLVVGALSMVWPSIIAIFLAALLLFQSFGFEKEIVTLSWAEIGQVPVVIASLRKPGLPAMLS